MCMYIFYSLFLLRPQKGFPFNYTLCHVRVFSQINFSYHFRVFQEKKIVAHAFAIAEYQKKKIALKNVTAIQFADCTK